MRARVNTAALAEFYPALFYNQTTLICVEATIHLSLALYVFRGLARVLLPRVCGNSFLV